MTKIIIDVESDDADFGWIIEQISRILPTVKVSQIAVEE